MKEREILCTLRSTIECNSLDVYRRQCKLSRHSLYATCPYQMEAVVPAEEPVEEPVAPSESI